MDDPRKPDDDFEMIDESSPPKELPMFPLPNVVLFPNMLLPLYIFEERYRLMFNDSLAGNRLIGMVLMKPGWENADGDPEPYEIGCMGRITKAVKFVNGTMNVLLSGMLRVKVERYEKLKPYRIAAITPLYDVAHDDEPTTKLAQQCRENFIRLLVMRKVEPSEFQQLKLLDSPLDIANSLCAHLQMDYHVKQTLLECNGVGERLKKISQVLSGYLGILN